VKPVKVVSDENAEAARRYEELLADKSFAFFVSVLASRNVDNLFYVVIGGPRKVGRDAIKLGAKGVLDAEREKGTVAEAHQFDINAFVGRVGNAVWETGDGPPAYRNVRTLRKLADRPGQTR